MTTALGRVVTTRRADGTLILENAVALPPLEGTIPARLAHWAAVTPEAIWLSEGERSVTYAAGEAARARLAARLLALDPALGTAPILLLGENGIAHALLMLAATSVGLAVAVVQPAYAGAAAAPWTKLGRVLDRIGPALVLADDPAGVSATLAELGADAAVRPLRDLGWLEDGPAADADRVRAAEAAVDLDTVAKLLFTSGSTGVPKAVPNTQRMMVSNMTGLALVWPFLAARPPQLTDWLPWSHTFGGNCCFNIALWFGGRLHIDHGRPVAARIGESVATLRRHPPTIYFNVPVGYELLLPVLEADAAFAAQFLGGVDFLFNAGAAMPAALRRRLETVAADAIGRIPPIVGGWGATETAPFSTVLPRATPHAGNLGIPMPGTAIKLVPDGERHELRVRGPNVMTGYWRDDAASAQAFDAERFYRIGDAGKLTDPDDPAAGILFDGRVSENFKLASGTFVNVGRLRLAAVDAGATLISDAVIAGEGRSELGLLVFPNEAACRALLGAAACAALDARSVVTHPVVIDRLAAGLRGHNARHKGSSMRFARFVVLAEPPSSAQDEITDKGYLNQRRVLTRRHGVVEALYASGMAL